MKKLEELLEMGGVKKDIALLVIGGIALALSFLKVDVLPFDVAWIAIILCGIPIILEAIIGLVTEFDIKADVLVSIALIASVCIGENFAAGEVAFIMQLGALLEDLTVARARAGIEKLVSLTPQTARVIRQGKELTIPAKDVVVGDVLRVLPGESVPVDGIILSGETSIDQAVMTGESMPVDKQVGDEVSSGTTNLFGSFEMKAVKVGQDSSIQRMVQLVQSADAGKAKIVGIADRWATWIVVIALTASVLTWLVTGQIIRAVTILVVFCPCSLVLATPTAIMAAIGNATKHGFLVKAGNALERLATVSVVTFDKTGTLTYGTPEVTQVKSVDSRFSEEELYRITASAEQYSEHPLGKAIVKCYKKKYKDFLNTDKFQMITGKGVQVHIDNRQVLVGNQEMMETEGISLSREIMTGIQAHQTDGSTLIYVAVEGKIAGYLALSDTMRPESAGTIDALKDSGIEPVLLTGDNKNTAEHIGGLLHIDTIHANCLPEDKLSWITDYQNQKRQVCMIGDGINDAPSLKTATVGIAMGGIGSDIAVDAADIALVNDEIEELPHLINLSKRMMLTIKCNLAFSMGLNFVAIILAMTGILNPIVGALVHNAGSVLVIVNSAILLQWKMKHPQQSAGQVTGTAAYTLSKQA